MIRKSFYIPFLLTLFGLGVFLSGTSRTSASPLTTLERVGLVIQFEDGRIEKKCIEINQTPFSGYDALSTSGYPVISDFNGSLGAAVCKIDQTGCSAENCFCDPLMYWSYWHLGTGQDGQATWMYSGVGSSNFQVTPGGVEGWRYSEGIAPAEKPSFAEICPAATATTVVFGISPTQTPAPAANGHLPTRPPQWATAVIIGQVAPTIAPPTGAPAVMLSPTPTTAIPPLTATPLPTQATTDMGEEYLAAVPVAAQGSPQPENTPETIVLTETKKSAPEKPSPQPETEESQVPRLRKAAGSPLQPAEVAASGFEEQNPNQRPTGKFSKWVILAGGLAGLGSLGGFFLLLLGGLVAIFILKQR